MAGNKFGVRNTYVGQEGHPSCKNLELTDPWILEDLSWDIHIMETYTDSWQHSNGSFPEMHISVKVLRDIVVAIHPLRNYGINVPNELFAQLVNESLTGSVDSP